MQWHWEPLSSAFSRALPVEQNSVISGYVNSVFICPPVKQTAFSPAASFFFLRHFDLLHAKIKVIASAQHSSCVFRAVDVQAHLNLNLDCYGSAMII